MLDQHNRADLSNVRYDQIGLPLARIDAASKANGTTRYAGDHILPRTLHAKILRSPIASGLLRSIDAGRARAVEGVACVLTREELRGIFVSTDIPGQTGRAASKDNNQPLVVENRIRYHGEPLAIVAAETPDLAAEAVALIEYQIDPLDGVYDIEAALVPGSPIVHQPDNVVTCQRIRKGDIDKGFREADLIVERTYKTQFIEHAFLEPEVGLAWIDEGDVINIQTATQVIEHYRTIADVLGVPANKVRIRGSMVGGGFGGKEDIAVEMFLAILTRKTRRPVRMEFSREESFLGHAKRHPFTLRYRTGVRRDGTITAVQATILADSGAYVYLSPYVILQCAVAAPGPYRVDNLFVEAKAVATNNMFTSAFRGFGSAQACIAYEQHMDEIAGELGIDPLELRRRNYLKTGEPISTGFVPPSAIWTERCADKAWELLGAPSVPATPWTRIGRGLAAYQQSYGRISWLKDSSEAWVGIDLDGTVVVRSGIPDIGAGQASSLAQIAAEILGVPMHLVTVYSSDTATTPLAGTTTATRGIFMSGNAVRLAAEAVRGRLGKRAAAEFSVGEDHIRIVDGRVSVRDREDLAMPVATLVRMCAADGIHRSELAIFRAPVAEPIDPETGQGQVTADYTFGAHAVEVAVDIHTGEVTVLKSVGVHDVGQLINLAAAEGQVEGGAAQGQGYALSEELIYRDGILVTPSLSEYLIPTAQDMPRVRSYFFESRSGLGPFGSKGLGEPSLVPVAPAIANAVANAIGARIYDFPITPEKVVEAIKRRDAEA